MKTSPQGKLLIIFSIVCIAIFAVPHNIMSARVTGNDSLVTTPEKKTVPVRAETMEHGAVKKEDPGKPSEKSRYVTIDFNNVDIRIFIKFMSELSGKNFVMDKDVKGTVTIVSPRKISVDEAYKVFESVLEVHGFAAIAAGDIVKIVPSRDALGKNIETRLKKEAISPEDKIVTQIVSLNYASPDEMKKVLTPLISKSSVIISYPPTGMLIVTDLLSNIKRLLTIITALDTEGIEEQISVIPLKDASSTEIAKSLNLIFQNAGKLPKGALTTPIKIVGDERTNTIITLASENDTFRIKQLIGLLDREVPKGEAKVRVYRLQNADAEELTEVLMNIPAKGTKTDEKGKSPVLSKDIQIIPDRATNTLVITADRDAYRVIEDVIKKLDIPRPMVYIEALIMEVNVDKGFKLGAEWQGGEYISTDDGRTKVYGGGFTSGGILPTADATTGAITFPEGFSVGVLGQAIQIGDFYFPNLGAVFQAYQKETDVHILSTPQLLTLDNEEAEIYVGENIPYQTRAETSSADIDYSSYEYKDVGVTLKITPQISQERFVRLNIYQEVTKVVDAEDNRPTTLKRTAKTTVTIKDKNTIVIGGLIGDDITNTAYKVPCIADIPIIGWLFKYKSESREKRNLFIFVTPRIVESPVEAKAIFEEKQEEINTVKEGVIKTYRNQSEKKQ